MSADVGEQTRRSRDAATYFLLWLDRIQAATERNPDYRTAAERAAVLQDIGRPGHSTNSA